LLDNCIETLVHFTFAFQSVCFTQEADESSNSFGEKWGEDICIKAYTLLVQVSCWTFLDELNTYINTFAQSRRSCQSDNCVGSRTSVLKEVNKNFPYFWVIRSGTGLGYPFAYQPCYAPFDNRVAASVLQSMQKFQNEKKTPHFGLVSLASDASVCSSHSLKGITSFNLVAQRAIAQYNASL
jgi:hypothetical protein